MNIELDSTEVSLIMYALRPKNFRRENAGMQERAHELQMKLEMMINPKTNKVFSMQQELV